MKSCAIPVRFNGARGTMPGSKTSFTSVMRTGDVMLKKVGPSSYLRGKSRRGMY